MVVSQEFKSFNAKGLIESLDVGCADVVDAVVDLLYDNYEKLYSIIKGESKLYLTISVSNYQRGTYNEE